jgi:divalent metal cation (Fe/Co/Zn/Cd) transporter
MDGNMTLYDAHERTSAIEHKLRERFGPETHVTLHTEPKHP